MRLVIKIGSNILTDYSKRSLNLPRIKKIAENISALYDEGHEVIIVSSGAVAAGMRKLGLKTKPTDIMVKQAAAAMGQPALMWNYEKYFKLSGRHVAQILLTRDGLADRRMFINAKNTILTLLSYGVVPIVNENDTVATDEIRFGDNDHLAFLVSTLAEAQRLIILSDVNGLYDSDPSKNKSACLIKEVRGITKQMIEGAGSSSSAVGTGGMYSKLLAAQKALRSGITVQIMNGKKPALIAKALGDKPSGTKFIPTESDRINARKGWIAFGSRPKGSITLDPGAVKAVIGGGKSLLPSGISAVKGTFRTGDAIDIEDASGIRVAVGLTNYSSDEISKIMRRKTSEIEGILGFKYSDEVIHHNNLAPLEDK